VIRFYSYNEIAEIFKVKVSTVKNWKAIGKLQIYGYRPFRQRHQGRITREAVFTEAEVLRLCEDIFQRGSWYQGRIDIRLQRRKNLDLDKDKDDEIVDEEGGKVKLRNHASDNANMEGDEVIVNQIDNEPN
jgi:transposase